MMIPKIWLFAQAKFAAQADQTVFFSLKLQALMASKLEVFQRESSNESTWAPANEWYSLSVI